MEEEDTEKPEFRPVHVNWLLTKACSAGCRHCYIRGRFGGPELGTGEALALLKGMAVAGVRSVCFTGGEFLARPDALALAEVAARLGLEVSVVTGGFPVTEEVAERLAALGVTAYLSIDGAGPEAHEGVRGPGSWGIVRQAARLLARAGVRMRTVTALSRLNAADAGRIPVTAGELGAEAACLLPAMPQGAMGRELALGAGEFAAAVRSAAEGAEAAGLELHLWCVPFAGALGDLGAGVRWWPCRGAPVSDISPDGKLLLCDVLDLTLADLRGRSFGEACREAAGRPEFAEAHFPARPVGGCRGCPAWSECRGGCFARAYLDSGSLSTPDPLCPVTAGLSG